MSDAYTPTDDEVRQAWVRYQTSQHDWSDAGTGSMFDRWLAAHDARVLRKARADMRSMMDGFPQRGRQTRATWALLWLDDRANRIEQEVTDDDGA